jgi:probable selenium-dependent hydroxylase accessory protein YqeC
MERIVEPREASDFFRRYGNGVITVIGSGGKTSLVWALARHFAEQKGRRVLVTTTTKMGAPDFASGLFSHFVNGPALTGERAPGVTFAGCCAEGSKKTTPPVALSALIQGFDDVLIEGDGSKMLPLKGWADYEPVVIPETTVTVGIIPVWPLGMPATESVIHRLPLFCGLTGATAGEALSTAHLAAAISGVRPYERESAAKRGLFAAARGKRVLFFNQVEDENAMEQAREIAGLLPAADRLDAVIAGSIKQNRVTILE